MHPLFEKTHLVILCYAAMSEYIANKNYTTNRKTKTLKEYEKNETKERKRNLLYLILYYLKEQNLQEATNALTIEAQLTNQYEVCDNIDLDIILQDYESYYFTKFNKMPKFIRKATCEETATSKTNSGLQKKKNRNIFRISSNEKEILPKSNLESTGETYVTDNFQIEVKSLTREAYHPVTTNEDYAEHENINCLKNLCDFKDYTPEWREIANLVMKEIVPKNLGVTWKDCVGLDQCIEVLKETVIYPIKYPKIFTGLVSPWRGILLFGPPGTGKTQLAKAVACESFSAFINVRSSSFISKWRGESEKMLKVLFDIAKFNEPTTIFIDEIDSIASRYEDAQHDASRRFKSELLMQMDGILNSDEQVFVLATTNSPWNLDQAILRRFEKRILLDVPTFKGRQRLFRYFFSKHNHTFQENDFEEMARLTNYFSGSDIRIVCKEVIMMLLREKLKSSCTEGELTENKIRKPTLEDVTNAIKNTTATTKDISLEKYKSWNEKYGNY